jgi:hypothetical protein
MPLSPSAKKSNRRGTGQKYSSKFTAGVLDTLIQDHLDNVTRNANTTEKWAGKMKASVLRKISACSKVAFLEESQRPEVLQAMIEKEQEKINKQTAKIKEVVANSIKHNKLTEVQVVGRIPSAYPVGRFDDSVSNISRQLATVAHQFNRVGPSLDSRMVSLRGTLTEVQNNWVAPAESSSASSKISGKGQGRPNNSSPEKGTGALGKLRDHLGDV